MHSAILGTAGYGLVVSSLVSLVLLIRKNVKRCAISSLQMLAISDTLSSVITGILLILNQYTTVPGPSGSSIYVSLNGTSADFFSRTKPSGQFVESLASNRSIVNATESVCEFRDVVRHYAMFTFPFVNAFVGLLSVSARTCTDLGHVVAQFGKLVETRESADQSNSFRSESVATALGLAGPWIIPILITAAFNFAGDETNVGRSQDMGCVYSMNFPFENCYTNESNVGMYPNGSDYTIAAYENYIETIDSSELPTNYSTEMEKKFGAVVSNIYDIVETVAHRRNESHNESTAFYDTASLLDITKFMEKNKEEIDDNGNIDYTRDQIIIDDQTTDNDEREADVPKIIDNDGRDDNEGSDDDVKVNYDLPEVANSSEAFLPNEELVDANEEAKLFESLLRNSSFESDVVKFERVSQAPDLVYNASTELNNEATGWQVTEKLPQDEMKPTVPPRTNEQIYADIVKKIHAVGAQLRKKKEFISRKTDRGRSQRYGSTDFSMSYGNDPEDTPMCMKSQCFVSTSFLKIHLFLLVFLLYFAPILASTVLHTRAKYACRSIREKLASKDATGGKKRVSGESLGEKASTSNRKDTESTGSSGWFPPESSCDDEVYSGSFEDLVTPPKNATKESGIERREKTSDSTSVKKNAQDDSAKLESMEKNMCGMEKHLKLFQTCFLVAVLAWTPLLLELLAKVFLCVDTARWLLDVSFLGALLFGIARNAFNLRMIDACPVIRKDRAKDNSVFPCA